MTTRSTPAPSFLAAPAALNTSSTMRSSPFASGSVARYLLFHLVGDGGRARLLSTGTGLERRTLPFHDGALADRVERLPRDGVFGAERGHRPSWRIRRPHIQRGTPGGRLERKLGEPELESSAREEAESTLYQGFLGG